MGSVYVDGEYYFDSSGHLILSGLVLYTPRDTLLFEDFDISDSQANNETRIKLHRLSSAELQEIFSDAPEPTDHSLIYVEPNPAGDPDAKLSSIKIGATIYSV